jgi:hypothetical protein
VRTGIVLSCGPQLTIVLLSFRLRIPSNRLFSMDSTSRTDLMERDVIAASVKAGLRRTARLNG